MKYIFNNLWKIKQLWLRLTIIIFRYKINKIKTSEWIQYFYRSSVDKNIIRFKYINLFSHSAFRVAFGYVHRFVALSFLNVR
jgi:hypothetical protein